MNLKYIKAAIAGLILTVSAITNAGLSVQGGTGSNGVGNIILTNGTVKDTGNSAYFNGATTPASDWVWDEANSTIGDANLIFTFSFSLTGYDIATASLSGLWGVDNVGSASLNGNVLSNLPNLAFSNFNQLHELSAGPNSGFFVSGLNVLTFDVNDLGLPGAFRASVEVTADAVPAPGMIALFLIGLAGIASRKISSKK